MEIGIFGGTFDPPHIGHLIVADQALHQLQLDEVWFCPVGQPPHKHNGELTPAHHRVHMTRLAIADHERFRISTIDVDRPPPHYTSGLLRALCQAFPQHHWTFLMGADSLMDLPNWHEPDYLLQVADLAVALRPDVALDLSTVEAALPQIRASLRWVRTPLLDVSSSELRRMARQGASLRYLVPRVVEAYITQVQLYAR
ncbi:MAG: nicotinate-nucleotide adenylyltransferase [Thermoflexales bacterium]